MCRGVVDKVLCFKVIYSGFTGSGFECGGLVDRVVRPTSLECYPSESASQNTWRVALCMQKSVFNQTPLTSDVCSDWRLKEGKTLTATAKKGRCPVGHRRLRSYRRRLNASECLEHLLKPRKFLFGRRGEPRRGSREHGVAKKRSRAKSKELLFQKRRAMCYDDFRDGQYGKVLLSKCSSGIR